MKTEIEAKWLDVDHGKLRKKLKALGAELVQSETKMIREVFDYPNKILNKKRGWVRVRNEGNRVTLSYKQLDDRGLHGTKEVTVTVDSYDETCLFLKSIGLISKSRQETKRESWVLDGTEIELDTWPWIPPLIEIEAEDEDGLKTTAKILGLELNEALHGSVETAYQAVYDVSEEEIDAWEEVVFSDVPDWLLQRKI